MRRRIISHWPMVLGALVIVVASLLFAVGLSERARQLDELLFRQCVANEIQDAVIVDQLRAAKRRARATLPKGAELLFQLQVLNDGINALEPADEPDCQPPKGA